MVLAPKNLQIKLLSRSGELLNVLNCAQGQITVLRALSNRELEPYRRAIAGITGPERFSVTIDDAPFRPEEHTLVGFGESYSSETRPLSELLLAAGAPEDSISAMALSYGLEEALGKAGAALSPCEARRAQILIATFAPFKALVLHEPFEPISSQWRERFAELLVNFAKTQKGLVLISALSFRPECFIENPLISKIQVGENIQKTIGFASTSSGASSIVQQVRDLLKEEEAKALSQRTSGVAKPSSDDNIHRPSGSFPLQAKGGYDGRARPGPSLGLSANTLLGGLAIVLLSALAISRNWFPFSYLTSTGGDESVAPIVVAQAPIEAPPTPVQTPIPVATVAVPRPSPEPVQQLAKFALDKYPRNIRDAVITSFGSSGGQPARRPNTPAKDQNFLSGLTGSSGTVEPPSIAQLPPQGFSSGSELIQFLKSASTQKAGNTAEEPQSPPAPNEGDMNEEQRREAIRQRFLEAITRASQNRKETDF